MKTIRFTQGDSAEGATQWNNASGSIFLNHPKPYRNDQDYRHTVLVSALARVNNQF